MSGRPWVQLATKVYTDPKMIKLPRDVFGNFVMCLAMAGANDDGGRLGDPDEVALMLHISEDEVARVVSELGGRIRADGDGCLWIRDWAQWQPPTTAADRARKAREAARRESEQGQPFGVTHQERRAPGTANKDVTLQQRCTNEDATRQIKNQEPRTKNQDTPLPPTGGAADSGQPLGQTFTAIVSGAMSGSLGGLRLTDRSGKKLLSWVVDVVKMLDAWTARDPDESVAIWLAFVDSDAWRFKGSDSSRWPAALGDWYANGRRGNTPKRADDGAAFDERYHARLDGGRVVLRDPSLTIAALGLACNPHDPATWPPDMRAAYAARIHVSDGREVFA